MTWKYLGYNLTPELIYLIECMKVEGYWSPNHRDASIQNKNIPFLECIKQILQKHGVEPKERVYIKIKSPLSNPSKNNIFLYYKSKPVKFHLEKSPFSKFQKIATIGHYPRNCKLKLIFYKKEIPVFISQNKEEMTVNSKLEGHAYLELRFHNKKFIKFLDKYSAGRRSSETRIEPLLFKAPRELVAAALTALIDSEGCIDYYKHTRRIRIRVSNILYLKDWRSLLAKFGIYSYIHKAGHLNSLTISGWDNFIKLQKLGLNLFHSKKKRKLEHILSTYERNQLSRNTALKFYVNEIQKIGKPVSATELSKTLGKSKRVINHYLTILDKKSLIKVDKSKVRYLYSAK